MTPKTVALHAQTQVGRFAYVGYGPSADTPISADRRGKAATALRVVASASAAAFIPRRPATTSAMRGSSPGSLRPCGSPAVALGLRPVKPVRLDVGRIGLHHHRLERQRGREPAQLQRALEGHRAAEAQLEAEVDAGLRLLLAAVEGMRDAAPRCPGATWRRCFSTLSTERRT